MAMTSIAEFTDPGQVIGGVDTHKDTHTAAVIDALGRALGTACFPATAAGYQALLDWMSGLGSVIAVGVEGTGSYGAGLAAAAQAAGITVVEVDRPDRKTRRAKGKSDPIDALAAARAVASGRATGTPKDRNDAVESLRLLRIAKRNNITARTKVINRIHSVVVSLPETLRAQFAKLTTAELITTAASQRPGIGDPTDITAADPAVAAKYVLRQLARQYQRLTEELHELEPIIAHLAAAIAPDLMDVKGVGPDVASQLLVTVGDNPDRLHSEASFAALTGVNPLPASSGKTSGRHRLNRAGDRQANAALYTTTISRMANDPKTKAYVTRKTAQGKSKKEIIRCLKRYIARELYPLLKVTNATT